MTEEELKKLRAIAESRIGPEGVAPSDEDVMGGGAPPGIAPPPTPPQPSQSETKYGRMGVPMLPVNWRERGEAFTRGAASLIGKPFPYEFIRDYGHGGIPGVTEPTPEPPLDAGFLDDLMTASQPELHAMGVYEDIVTPLYGAAAEITPKDWPALLGYYQDQADVSRGLGFAGVDVKPPDGFSPSEGWLFQDLRERIGELATPGQGVQVHQSWNPLSGELKARDQAYREALEAGDIPAWMDAAYRISVDPLILFDILGLRKLAATAKSTLKLIPKTARTTIQSATDDVLKLLKDKNVLPSQSYPQPMDPSVRADVDAIDKIIDQGRPAAAAAPPTVTQPDVDVPIQEGQMQFLGDPAAYAMPERAVTEEVVPVSAVPEEVIPPVSPVDSVVTGFREGESTKALPPIESITDNYTKPLSEYTDRIFHETSFEYASEFLPRDIGGGHRPPQDMFFSNKAYQALGQRGKGVLIEFSTEGVNGGRNIEGRINRSKPSWEFQWKQGDVEFTTNRYTPDSLVDNVLSVTVEKGAKAEGNLSRSRKKVFDRLTRDWVKKTNPDGSVTYTPPKAAVPEEVIPPVAPADISTARTGRPFSGSLFRGSGRKTIEEVYDPHYVQGPIFGEATYSSPIREFAQEFGPQVDEIQINLRNPLVISSDQEWLVIRNEAGLFSSVPINPEEVTRLRQVIQNKGHDGVIIRVPDSEATGKSLQKAFGQDTVVDFTRAAPEAAIPPVAPAAKLPPLTESEIAVVKQAAEEGIELVRVEGMPGPMDGATRLAEAAGYSIHRDPVPLWLDNVDLLYDEMLKRGAKVGSGPGSPDYVFGFSKTHAELFRALERLTALKKIPTDDPTWPRDRFGKLRTDLQEVTLLFDEIAARYIHRAQGGKPIAAPLGRPSLIREAFVPEELPTEGLRTDPRGMRTTDPDAPLVERVPEADIEVFGETQTELNVTRMWEGGKETLDVRAIGERPANSKIFKVRITPYTPKGVTQTDSGAILVPDPDWMKDVFEGRFTEKLGKQAQVARLALTPIRKAAEGMKNKGIEKTKLPWFDKTIRSVGHIIDIGEQINPSIFVKGFLDRALIAYRGTEDAIQTNTVLKMAALRQLGNDVWRVDTDVNSATYGDIQNLPPQKLREGGSTNFHDVLTYSDQFTFNDQQKKWIAIARDLLDEDLRLNREAGIDISELNFYHSINDAPEFVDVVGGTKRTAEGYYWPRVIQNTDDAEKGLVQGIPVGSEKSREKMREYLLARDANIAGIKYALTPDITLEKTLTAGAQSRRDMNFIKFMSDTNNPYFRKMVPDGPTFAQMKVGEFLKPEAVSNVYGDPSGAWAGKRFRGVLVTPEMDKALKKISRDLKVHDGAWIKNLQTINGAIRFLQTGYDVGHMFIQGQVALGGRREQWARASMAMFRAFLDPKLAQKKLGQDSAIIAEMAQRDAAPFLASEFVEASVSGLMSKLPFAQRFAAMFNMFMDQARIELYRSYRHRVLHKYGLEAPNARSAIDRSVIDATPGLARDLHEMVKAVDNMVGVSSARQLGVTETRQSIERAYLFYASNYRRGVGGAMVDFFQGGMRGEVARDAQGRAMMATMLFFGGAAIGLGQFDNSNRDRAPIIGSGAIFKPWDRRFMTLRIGGMELGLGGAYVSTYRFLGSLYGALTDSDGYQGKTDGIRDKVQRFMRSNTAPTTGAIADVFMDSDWKGDPVKNFPGAVTLFAERALPFWASPFITDGWLGEKPLSDVALGSGLSMTGLRESTASPRDVISTRELGEEYRNIEEPFLKDLILSLVNREHTFRETEFTELRDAEFNKLLNLSREIGLSEQQIVNKYFAIINEYRGRRDQAAGELHFPERKARSENEEALFAVWEMLASATTDAERRKGYEELEAQATPEQQAFVDRNLNRRMIPERLYLLLPRSVTEKLDDSLRLRVAYLQEIGRSDLIQEMRDSYIIKEEPDPADDGGVDRQVLDDLQKIRRSGYEDLMTDTAIAQWIKRRMDTSFSPYIEIYIDADRGKRGNLTTRSDDKAIYKQIESMLSNAGRKLKQRQLEFIDDLRKDGAYGDLEFLLWHYDRHPNENLRKRDAVFMKEYESWRGNRPAIGVG